MSKANLTITLDKSADLHTEAEWLRSTIQSQQAALNIEDAKVTQGSGTGFNISAFSVIVSGNNYDSVLKASDDLLTGLKGVPNLVNVTSNAARAKPEIRVKVDPAKALVHGSTPYR